MEKTFADGGKIAKFVKVFSFESFPLYGILFLQSPSFTDPSLHVSDSSSLESRSQGLINRGCSLVSPSSTTASSPPANSYFTSKRGDIVVSECLTALMNTAAAPTDGLTSATSTTHTKGDSMHTKSIIQLSSPTPRPLPGFQSVCSWEWSGDEATSSVFNVSTLKLT